MLKDLVSKAAKTIGCLLCGLVVSQEIVLPYTWQQAKASIVAFGDVNSPTPPIALPISWGPWGLVYPPSTTNRTYGGRTSVYWDPALLGVNYPVKLTGLEFFSTFGYCDTSISRYTLPDGGTRQVCRWNGYFNNPYPIHLFNWDVNHPKSGSPVVFVYELQPNERPSQRSPLLYNYHFRATKDEALAGISYQYLNLKFKDWRNPPARVGVYYHDFVFPERGQLVLNPNKRYVVAVANVPFKNDEAIWYEVQTEAIVIPAHNSVGPFIPCSQNSGGGPVPREILLSALGSVNISDYPIPGYDYSCGDPEYYWPNYWYRSRHAHVCYCLRIHRELGIVSPFDEARDARPNLGVVGFKAQRLDTCGADVDCSGCVDDSDLLSVLFKFGEQSYTREDINGDFSVDDADLLEVLFNFGSGC